MNEDKHNPTEPAEWSDAALDAEPVLSHRALRRIGWAVVVVLVLILLSVVPPLLNVNRYQHRVAQAISASIGRPVHFDAIHLHLLPLPGLTIQNFVVDEDPAFGYEPAMRANTVEARLRFSSLWRRRVEVSTIKLLAPSINLVRRSDGRWNLQGIVTQAGYLRNAPTTQGRAGAAPRFPYIEATDARINVKATETKLPWSLLDAKLALWLPDEHEWRVRVQGRPLRTDTDVSDVGELDLEGSLGRGDGGVLNQPLAISAHWASTPLGEAAKLIVGRDTGFRGAASAELEIRGTPAHMQISSDMHLHNLRRSEFVPRLPMSLNAHCQAAAQGILHALNNIRCAIPTTSESAGLFQGVFRDHDDTQPVAAPGVFFLQADVPDMLQPKLFTATLNLAGASPEYFLNWLRVLSSRIPDGATAAGKAGLSATWNSSAQPGAWTFEAACACTFTPAMQSATTEGAASDAANPQWLVRMAHGAGTSSAEPAAGVSVTAARVLASAGSAEPALSGASTSAASAEPAIPHADRVDPASSIRGEISRTGATMQYPSLAVLRYAASLLPPLADDLPSAWVQPGEPAHGPLQSQRTWRGPQSWTAAPVASVAPAHRKRSR